MPIHCKYDGKTCPIEAERFGKEGPGSPSTEKKTDRGEDGIFFHGVKLLGCCEGHQLLRHTRVPDLLTVGKSDAFGSAVDGRWLPYAAAGGYSAGRKPMIRYVQNHGSTLKYAFLLDPSYPDRDAKRATIDYGTTILTPWISGGNDRRLLVIYGAVSAAPAGPKEPPIIEQWIGALRGLDDKIKKRRIVVWRTGEDHLTMRHHIPAMEDPSYKPKGGKLDDDFAKSFS